MSAFKNTTPQYDLAVSILNQARRDLRRFTGVTQATKRELYLNAYDWVVSDSRRWPFSFRNVCEMLSLSPEDVREEMFRAASSEGFQSWNRRFGSALRQFHISLRQVAISEGTRTTPKRRR